MKVALINPTPMDHYSPGLRVLAKHLKLHGHSARIIFVPADTYGVRFDSADIMQLPQSMIRDVIDLLRDMDMVGVSFLSSMFDVAVQVTRAVQKNLPDKFLLWGGFHTTTMPHQALEFVDNVCVGEGEEALIELVERLEAGEDYYDVRNFWFRKPNGKVVGNGHFSSHLNFLSLSATWHFGRGPGSQVQL